MFRNVPSGHQGLSDLLFTIFQVLVSDYRTKKIKCINYIYMFRYLLNEIYFSHERKKKYLQQLDSQCRTLYCRYWTHSEHCTAGTVFTVYYALQVLNSLGSLYFRYWTHSVHCTLYCRYWTHSVLCTAGTGHTVYFVPQVLDSNCTLYCKYGTSSVHFAASTGLPMYTVLKVLDSQYTLY